MTDPRPDFHSLLQGFLRNPESPEGLALQSSINAALAPRVHACELLTEALVHQLDAPGSDADTALVVARCVYEAHVQRLDAGLLADFAKEARKRRHERRCQPPPIESILSLPRSPDDAEYDFAGGLGGLRGCWHRLWGADAMQALGLLHLPTDAPDPLQEELEGLLGRPLQESERAALRQHAQAHAVYLASPEAQEHLGGFTAAGDVSADG